jgi:hypothetical protein
MNRLSRPILIPFKRSICCIKSRPNVILSQFRGVTYQEKVTFRQRAATDEMERVAKVAFHKKTWTYYALSVIVFFWGLTFWSVPLWRVFCESDQSSWQEVLTGRLNHDTSKVSSMEPIYDHPMVIRFCAR